jgi:hypothetical protein
LELQLINSGIWVQAVNFFFSKTSTPLSGSLENLGGGELLRKAFNNSATGKNLESRGSML